MEGSEKTALRPLSSFDTHARWLPLTQSARSRRSLTRKNMGLCLVYLSPLFRILEMIIMNPARIDRVETSKLCVRLVSPEMTGS